MERLKLLICTAFASLTGWLGIIAVPIYTMVVSSVIDYMTGLYAAKYRKQEISSYHGIRGIVKKILIWSLVIVGVLIDTLVSYVTEVLGFRLGAGMYISCLIAIWITCNEIISVLENIKDADVPVPEWLAKVLVNIKSQIDVKVEKSENEIVKKEEKKYDISSRIQK